MSDRVQVGNRYGRLVVVSLIPDRKNPAALCRCDCGGTSHTQRGALKSGKAQSCGCIKADFLRAKYRTHGMSRTPLYSRWKNMLSRCTNPDDPAYENYGGRGIVVEWKTFEDFFADMGDPPEGAWLERKNNDGPYSQENCIWSKPADNLINKRTSQWWVIAGVRYESSRAAARALGVDPSEIHRGCTGYTKNGRRHSPRVGWSTEPKYRPDHV